MLSLGLAELVVIAIVICGFLSLSRKWREQSTRRFSIRMMLLALGILMMLGVVGSTLRGVRELRTHTVRQQAVLLAPQQSGTSTAPASLLVSEYSSDSEPRGGPGQSSGPGQSTADPETLWLPITRDMLLRLRDETVTNGDADLSVDLPIQLTQAYTLMRLPPPSGGAAAPVIRQTLSQPAIRILLTQRNLRTLISTVAEFLPSKSEHEPVAPALVAEAMGLPNGVGELASWVNESPGLGQFVVTSQFKEATTPAEAALRPAITEAFESHVTHLCARDFGIGDGWKKLMDVSVTDRVVRDCIVKTDRKVEVLETVDGAKMMQQTYALIEFPEAVEGEVLSAVRRELIRSRTASICIVLAAVWLSGVLLTIALRASQSGSFLRKLATVPAMLLLVLPCVLLAVAMISAMTSGDTLELRLTDNRPMCVVDAVSN